MPGHGHLLPAAAQLTAEPKSQNIVTAITHSKAFPASMFTYPNVRQCFAITALLSGFVPRSATFSSLMTLCTRNLCDLISSCTHNYATSKCFSSLIPCMWRMCSVVFASMFNTGFTAKAKSRIILWTPFASDAPDVATYSSASALLFRNDLLLSCVCFHGVSSQHQNACARMTFEFPCNLPSPCP